MKELQQDFDDRLARICLAVFGAGARVVRCEDRTAGAENHLYALDVERPGGGATVAGVMLKLYSGGEPAARIETEVMAALHAVGFPVPALFHVELDAAALGLPFSLMQRIDGSTLGRAMRDATADQAALWLRRFAELSARLHALDPTPFVKETKGAGEHLDRELARSEQSLRDLEVPEFRPVFDWLIARRRELAVEGPALIHQDYHPLNVVVDADGALYVLDWTLAHVTDPRSDLAQTLQMLSSSGFGMLRAPIVSAYEASRGRPLTAMEFFDVFAALKNVAGQYAVLDDGERKRPALWARLSRRPGWAARSRQLRAIAPRVERTYRFMAELSGVQVPEAERLFASLAGL